MALIRCPECNAEISDKALACPQCGAPREATASAAAALDGKSEAPDVRAARPSEVELEIERASERIRERDAAPQAEPVPPEPSAMGTRDDPTSVVTPRVVVAVLALMGLVAAGMVILLMGGEQEDETDSSAAPFAPEPLDHEVPMPERPEAEFIEGVGWRGKITLCDAPERVQEAFGPPTIVNEIENVWHGLIDKYEYEDAASRAESSLAPSYLTVVVHKPTKRVIAVAYEGPWRTTRGLRQGETELDMRRLYGDRFEEGMTGGSFEYENVGLTFYTTGEDREVADDEGLTRRVRVLGSIELRLDRRRCPRALVEAADAPAGLRAVMATTASASSEVRRHPAAHAIDHDLGTAWNEGAQSDGTGEWLELRLDRPARISRVEVYAGYWGRTRTGVDLFSANNRPSRLTIAIGNSYAVEVPVADEQEVIVVESERPRELMLNPAPADTVRVTIVGVYRGSRWNDLCVTEVRVFEPE